MNGTKIESKTKTRRMLVRGVLAIVYIALMSLAFVMGKGHTILLDNKDSEDGSLKAFANVNVSVDGQEPINFTEGVRDQTKVTAQKHTIKIIVMTGETVDANGQTVEPTVVKTIEKKFTVPLGMDIALLSIPKLAAGVEPALISYVVADQPAPAADPNTGNSNEFTSPGGTPEVPVVPGAPAPAAPVVPAPAAP